MYLDKDNYVAWGVKEEDFPKEGSIEEQVLFLANYAVLAPSAHNTQPWLLEITDNEVIVNIDKKKALGFSDLLERQTYESIGAFLFNLFCAANYFGFNYSVEYDFLGKVQSNGNIIVCKLSFEKSLNLIESIQKKLFLNINKRHSAKLKYKKDILSLECKSKMESFQDNDLCINFIDDEKKIESLSKLVYSGTLDAFSKKDFCLELSEWVRPAWTRRNDGMPANTVGVPYILSGLIPFVIKHFNTGKIQAKDVQNVIMETPVIGVISVSKNDKLNWLKAGMFYEKLALSLIDFGFYSSIMGAPIECEESRLKLKNILNLDDEPAMFFRIGIPFNIPLATPRFLIKDKICNKLCNQ